MWKSRKLLAHFWYKNHLPLNPKEKGGENRKAVLPGNKSQQVGVAKIPTKKERLAYKDYTS